MNKLAIHLKYDHNFISIKEHITSVIPVLFVATGCDYIRFFKCHPKQYFFYTLTKHAEFTYGGKFPFSGKLYQIKDEWELVFFVIFEISWGRIL